MFKIGDVAVYTGGDPDRSTLKKGTFGIVAAVDDRLALVEFGDNWLDGHEHGANNLTCRSAWWLPLRCLEKPDARPFRLVALGPDGDEPFGDERYADGKEAAAAAKLRSQASGRKIQVRKLLSSAVDWRKREKMRLEMGFYEKLPPAWDLAPIEDHFAHVARSDRKQIAFTPDEERGEADRQTMMSPGRYLERYYPHLAQEKMKGYIARIDGPPPIDIATDPDEIEKIYTAGPRSCMSHAARHFQTKRHPVRVYGGSDLALAYIRSRDGRIVARAVVDPAKKAYARSYGDTHRIEKALADNGYVRSAAAMKGSRLPLVWHERSKSTIVVPYVDGFATGWADVEAGEIVLGDPPPDKAKDARMFAFSPGGISPLSARCARSGAATYNLVEVVVAGGARQLWDVHVANREAANVAGMDGAPLGLHDRRILHGVRGHASEYVTSEMLDAHFVVCPAIGWFVPRISLVRYYDGSAISRYAVNQRGWFICDGNGLAYPADQRFSTHDGVLLSADYLGLDEAVVGFPVRRSSQTADAAFENAERVEAALQPAV